MKQDKQIELFPRLCGCEDSNGVKCTKEMTSREIAQDGRCQACVDEVWYWLKAINKGIDYTWSHKGKAT